MEANNFCKSISIIPVDFSASKPLIYGWANEQDKCLLSVCFKSQTDNHKVFHDFMYDSFNNLG